MSKKRRRGLAVAIAGVLAGASMLVASAGASAAGTVWLCKPGQLRDPCTPGLSTTVYSPRLEPISVSHPRQLRHPAVDCFYVYPTVSDQKTVNANLHVDPVERSIALYQTARYSQYCRVFAPMYRQLTLLGISRAVTPAEAALALNDVRRAFHQYLSRYNHGRGFVLIGHSQGAYVLRRLIALDVDRKPVVRRRLLSAILLGGNVLVRAGSRTGGDFKHIAACRSKRELGCVIAFSTFDQPVPANAKFGRSATRGLTVLCTNPASLYGHAGLLDPIFPSKPIAPQSTLAIGIKLLGITLPMPATVWASAPGLYRARCSSAGHANVLQITPMPGAPTLHPSPDPSWGLHLTDANIALGNLIEIVRSQAAAFLASHR